MAPSQIFATDFIKWISEYPEMAADSPSIHSLIIQFRYFQIYGVGHSYTYQKFYEDDVTILNKLNIPFKCLPPYPENDFPIITKPYGTELCNRVNIICCEIAYWALCDTLYLEIYSFPWRNILSIKQHPLRIILREILDPGDTHKEAVNLDIGRLISLIDFWGINFCIEDENGEIPWGLVKYTEISSSYDKEISSDCGKIYLIKLQDSQPEPRPEPKPQPKTKIPKKKVHNPNSYEHSEKEVYFTF